MLPTQNPIQSHLSCMVYAFHGSTFLQLDVYQISYLSFGRTQVGGSEWNYRSLLSPQWQVITTSSHFVVVFYCFLDDCSFKDNFCSWINDNSDDFDWLHNSGETMTRETGPSSDADGDGNSFKGTLCRQNSKISLSLFPRHIAKCHQIYTLVG